MTPVLVRFSLALKEIPTNMNIIISQIVQFLPSVDYNVSLSSPLLLAESELN